MVHLEEVVALAVGRQPVVLLDARLVLSEDLQAEFLLWSHIALS